MFEPLSDRPDHAAIELAILERWDHESTFDQVRAKNAGGPRFSFFDGPVTANKVLGVHTAWGRTLKDAFQRYKALRGYHQRYQNGFDCQGLWIEVGVERELGLNSKRDIETYGLAEFARRCRAVVEWSAEELTKGSIRLGQWMDWERSYYTFADTNIEYIWRFLATTHERGWLYMGHRPTEWCPRCGTSISAHELVGSYIDRDDPSLSVRFPLLDRPGQCLVIWTTTPWTLPANVAVAVRPDAHYGLHNGDWIAVDRSGGADADLGFDEVLLGADLVGWRYEGPFDSFGTDVEHRVVPWADVSMEEGTGLVHIAPGCGNEDFALSKEHDLAVVSPVDESGLFYPQFGWLAGRATSDVAEEIIDDLRRRHLLVGAGTITHRFPECWRCHTPLIFRVSDDWFISVDEIRAPMREANDTVEWTPAYMGKRMDDWLVNMSDWNISRRRYYGLPLPFYPCPCGHLNVIGSRAELAERAVGSLDGLEELRRPWIDEIEIRCAGCDQPVRRIEEVGDVWLDAGIVPLSTLGWQNPEAVAQGFGTGAAKGLTVADLPDHAYWEEWFPADWVSEMREQIRLWFYAQLFMSVAMVGRAPYRKVLGYEKMLDEHGREMHGSWGNAIEADDAFERMGADVMRWQYCAQPPNQNLLFGFGPAQEIRRKLLTLWNSVSFFVQYAMIESFVPDYAQLGTGPIGGSRGDLADLDQWAVARTRQLLEEATEGYEDYLTVNVLRSFESYIDDLSNWYIRRSRRRFWQGDPMALASLWYCLVQAIRVVSPIMPFLAEHLWQMLVANVCPEAPSSVFLAEWPTYDAPDRRLLDEVAAVRKIVDLGRQARAASNMRLRQPLRRLIVEGGEIARRHGAEIGEELRVNDVEFGVVDATQLKVRPNLKVLGPRLGHDVGVVRKALEAGEFEALDGGVFRVAGHDLGPDDVLVERSEKRGWAVAATEGITIALDVSLDDELLRRAKVYDTIHHVNGMRKDAGLALTDRIRLSLPEADEDLLDHRDWIMADTLAVEVGIGSGDTIGIAPA
jgi:isoleucyl-tRNA synthetase